MQKAIQKAEIRKKMLEKRLKLEEREVMLKSRHICLKLFTNFFLLKGNIGVYYPFKNEVSPLFLKRYGVYNVSLPSISKCEMHFKEWHFKGILEPKKNGILEPLKNSSTIVPSIILVPMIAFDEKCYRIGYGGGYYDKFFSSFDGLKIGLALEMQKISHVPVEPFDIKLDYIITENNIYN
jgi:5-formyltetrahydrofolate cyclo-ligase